MVIVEYLYGYGEVQTAVEEVRGRQVDDEDGCGISNLEINTYFLDKTPLYKCKNKLQLCKHVYPCKYVNCSVFGCIDNAYWFLKPNQYVHTLQFDL